MRPMERPRDGAGDRRVLPYHSPARGRSAIWLAVASAASGVLATIGAICVKAGVVVLPRDGANRLVFWCSMTAALIGFGTGVVGLGLVRGVWLLLASAGVMGAVTWLVLVYSAQYR